MRWASPLQSLKVHLILRAGMLGSLASCALGEVCGFYRIGEGETRLPVVVVAELTSGGEDAQVLKRVRR